MTIEKVKLTDFTSEELAAGCLAITLTLAKYTGELTPREIEAIRMLRTQMRNAKAQREKEEKTLMN